MKIASELLLAWYFMLVAFGQGSSGRGADFVTVIGPFGSEQQCNAYRAQVAEPNARAAYACWNAKDQS